MSAAPPGSDAPPRGEALAEPAAAPGEAVGHDPRLAALLPVRALDPGEIVLLMRRPSAWAILLDAGQGLAVVLALVCVLALLRQAGLIAPSGAELAVLGAGLAAIRLFWQFLDWCARLYVLTDRRVVRIAGTWRMRVAEVPLRKLRAATVDQGALERVLGIGTVAFHTTDAEQPQCPWHRVAAPEAAQREIHRAMRRYR